MSVVIVGVCLGLLASVARAQSMPIINSAVVDYVHNTLTVSGINFGSSPKVTVGKVVLLVCSAKQQHQVVVSLSGISLMAIQVGTPTQQ